MTNIPSKELFDLLEETEDEAEGFEYIEHDCDGFAESAERYCVIKNLADNTYWRCSVMYSSWDVFRYSSSYGTEPEQVELVEVRRQVWRTKK
jgi:hypothetical protein